MNKIIVFFPNEIKIPAGGESSLMELVEFLPSNTVYLRLPFGRIGPLKFVNILLHILINLGNKKNRYHFFIPEVFLPYFGENLKKIKYSIVCLNHRYILLNWEKNINNNHIVEIYKLSNSIITHPEESYKYLKAILPDKKIYQYFFNKKYNKLNKFDIYRNRINVINRIKESNKLVIGYMPRKRYYETNIIINELKLLSEINKLPIEFIKIDKSSWDQTMNIFKSIDVFFCTSYLEGYGRPPLEAISHGIILCGFDGGITKQYENIIYCKNSENTLEYFDLLSNILKNPVDFKQEIEIISFKEHITENSLHNTNSIRGIIDNIVYGEKLGFLDLFHFIYRRYIKKLFN